MRVLRAHHIVNLVDVVDNFFPRESSNPFGGITVILHQNECIALLLFNSFVAPQLTLKSAYNWAKTYYYHKFRFCSYRSLVRKCH